VGSNRRLKDRLPVPLQSGKRALFIGRHQPGVPDDVGRENGGEFPIDAFFGHVSSEGLSPPNRTIAVRNITWQRIHPDPAFMRKWTRHPQLAQSNFSGALLIGGAVQRRAMDCIRAGSPDTKTSALVSCLTAPIGIEWQIHE
jgi:hypothetical protein